MAAGAAPIEGLAALRKGLKKLGNITATREFKEAGYTVGRDVVIPAAQSAASALGRMQARAAETLKPVRTVTGGAVRFGGDVVAMGAEFGAVHDAPRQTARGVVAGWNQFLPWKGSGGDAGYFVWPTIRDRRDAIVEGFDQGLLPVYREVAPD